jgi:predicted transcriptional regulator
MAAAVLADRSEHEASKTKQKIVFELRSSGYSVTDMAVILGVTRARVSQVLRNL